MAQCLPFGIPGYSRHMSPSNIVMAEQYTHAINQCWLLLQCLLQTFQLLRLQVRCDALALWQQLVQHLSTSKPDTEHDFACGFVVKGMVTLGSVIQDLICITGEDSIKYGYVAVPRNQRETECHAWLLVAFRPCVGYPLAQLVRLPYTVQEKSDCFIRKMEALAKLTKGLTVSSLWSPTGSHHL